MIRSVLPIPFYRKETDMKTMRYLKKLVSLLLASLLLGTTAAGLIPAASTADSDAFAGWQTDEWTVGEEGGEPALIGSRSKTLNLLYSDPTASPEVAELDLEFTEQASLGGFVASGDEVSLGQGARDGALVYTLDGTGTYLQSPTIVASVGDAYCARLDIKNTIFLRLKNDTDHVGKGCGSVAVA